MYRKMILSAQLLVLSVAGLTAQPLQTPGEISGYSRYTQHEEIVQFLSAAASRSASLRVSEVGRTLAVDEYPSKSLLLCVITAEGASRPEELDRSKVTLLITAAQHGNEHSAKEAALAIIRELTTGDLQPLLRKANFLIMPQTNPWGSRFDRRVNELGLDMNRDHVKMESQGVQAIHKVFRAWMPEVTLDVHERGDDYYQVTMGCLSNLNADPAIQEYSRRVILATVSEKLAEKKIPFHEYVVTSEMMPNDASGADFSAADLAGKLMITRYSTSDINDGRNSHGLYQTFSFIQEGASRHDIATLRARTRYQMAGIRAFLETVVANGPAIMIRVRELRSQLREQASRFDPAHQVHLKMEYRRDPAAPELALKTFRQEEARAAGVLKVDKKAGEPVQESELEKLPAVDGHEIITRIVKEWFPRVAPTLSVTRPLGYIIPAQQSQVIEALRRHDVQIMTFTADVPLQVEGYLTRRMVPAHLDYLPPDTLIVEPQSIAILCKKGDFFISGAQPAANLLPCLLEPESDYGLIRYRHFALTPEAGSYYAIYRLVQAREMPLRPWADWPR